MSNPPQTVHNIAIIGAGISGLTLAAILHSNGIACTVFERRAKGDAAVSPRWNPSVRLDGSSTQKALKAAGVWDDCVKASRPRRGGPKVLRADGQIAAGGVGNKKPGSGADSSSAPSGPDAAAASGVVDRAVLKGLLVQKLPEDAIHWDTGILTATPAFSAMACPPVASADGTAAPAPARPQARWTLAFQGGAQSSPYDLIVGADGAQSSIGSVLSQIQPGYSGFATLDMSADSAVLLSDSTKTKGIVADGSTFVLDENRALVFRVDERVNASCRACVRMPLSSAQQTPYDLPERRKEFLDQWFGDVAPGLLEAAKSLAEGSGVLKSLNKLTSKVGENGKEGLTVIGRAAGFDEVADLLAELKAGQSDDEGLVDAVELGRRIVESVGGSGAESRTSLRDVVKGYETTVLDRTTRDVEITERLKKAAFGKHGSIG